MKELVSIEWLKKNLNKKDLILLDSSLTKTADGKNSEFKDITIPSARYFDLTANFSDKNSHLPNTIPSKEQFELECRKLGISQSSEIVIFDNLGIYSSPRAWWMFKAMGHDKVSVLDGGLKTWIKRGLPTEKRTKSSYEFGTFEASLNEDYIVNYSTIRKNIEKRTFTLIDARSEDRFNGIIEEPRKELKSGHIKESINIPYKEVLTDGKYKSKEELKKLFSDKCNIEDDFVFSCGSGLTACIVLLACEIAIKKSRYVYDGSWTEWAEKNNLKNTIQHGV
ncbi:sulfurtransferase [uncultured Psychroserpens sp.]|uniref:sulfurtransferase n=1 Tax=uncultured Psychroserpens sp. TaxID=255436 RepID=UPI002613E487|nr:sulfurtransferase [uncultured Psychroserpens sp.]